MRRGERMKRGFNGVRGTKVVKGKRGRRKIGHRQRVLEWTYTVGAGVDRYRRKARGRRSKRWLVGRIITQCKSVKLGIYVYFG